MNAIGASGSPSPKTVCVRERCSPQSVQVLTESSFSCASALIFSARDKIGESKGTSRIGSDALIEAALARAGDASGAPKRFDGRWGCALDGACGALFSTGSVLTSLNSMRGTDGRPSACSLLSHRLTRCLSGSLPFIRAMVARRDGTGNRGRAARRSVHREKILCHLSNNLL